jgi:glutathione S-transferase
MITLYTFGPYFGLPDPSPFVMKAEVLLKMACLPYRTDTGGFKRAPKGKLPYIDDAGEIVADSTLIRLYIESKYGFDFDAGLSAAERGTAWAMEKMCEDHLYWAGLNARWMIDQNFDKGPRRFFDQAPALMRPLIVLMVRRRVKRNLWGHGMGRHTVAEMEALAARDIDAVADVLADKPYLMGAAACGADASVFAFMAHAVCPLFDTGLRTATERRPNLVAYRDRLMRQYFPDFAAPVSAGEVAAPRSSPQAAVARRVQGG